MLIRGHMTPALAVLEELPKKGCTNIVWLGQKYSQTGDRNLSAEYKIIRAKKIKFIPLKTGKLWRKWTAKTTLKGILNLILIPIGFFNASYILVKERPDIIIGFGGYLNVPIFTQFYITKPLKIKTYLHIQTLKPDLATKLVQKFVDKIFVSWESTLNTVDKEKALLTGNPIHPDFISGKVNKKLFNNNLPVMLVIGGNQGSNTFNRRLKLPILENYLREVNIVHQTGSSSLTNDHKIALNQRNRLNQKLRSRYLVYDFLKFEELNNVLNQTSLVLSRSGANTTQLIMYKGIPTIFMPLPWSSNNEQLENAQIAAETGLAKVFEFKEGLTEQALFSVLEKAIDQITQRKSFKSNTTWTEAKQAALKLAQINAAELIAASIIDNTTTKSS